MKYGIGNELINGKLFKKFVRDFHKILCLEYN
jgi:hypothetical protein